MDSTGYWNNIPSLCRAESSLISTWLNSSLSHSLVNILPILILSNAIYGATLGMWHGPTMSLYVAIKFPCAILITLGINTMINGIIASLTGSGISLRQSLQFLLTGFTLFGIIMASISPILFFMNFNAPAPMAEGMAQSYRVFLTTNVLLIIFAGVVSHKILLKHVRYFANSERSGSLTFFYWLLVNFFVGSEVTHTLRPFFGAPKLKVEFLRDDMFARNFYESVYHVLRFIF